MKTVAAVGILQLTGRAAFLFIEDYCRAAGLFTSRWEYIPASHASLCRLYVSSEIDFKI